MALLLPVAGVGLYAGDLHAVGWGEGQCDQIGLFLKVLGDKVSY